MCATFVWRDGDDHANIMALIEVSNESLIYHVPEIASARYDFNTGTFRTGQGQPLTNETLQEWSAQSGGVRAARAGCRTIKRGILLNTLLRSESGARPGLLEQVLRQSRNLVGLDGTFYQRNGPTFDIDGKPVIKPTKMRAIIADLRKHLDKVLKQVKLISDPSLVEQAATRTVMAA